MIVALLAACSNPRTPGEPEFVELHLGTHQGVSPMKMPVRSGITSALASLAFPASDFDNVARHGNHVIYHVRDLALVQQLADAEQWPSTTTTISGQDIDVTFANEDDAAIASFIKTIFATGPYEQSDFTGDELVLRRRSGKGPERIRATSVANQDEEWRRFLAREFDVVPDVSSSQRQYLAEVPSVRLLPYAKTSRVALYFSVTSDAVKDRSVRRAIAEAIRRGPLASTIGGTAVDAVENQEEARRTLGPRLTLTLAVPLAMNDFGRAALILQSQLRPFGIDIVITAFSSVDSPRDLAIFYEHDEFLGSRTANLSHYFNPALSEAIDAGNQAEIHRIIDEDVPLTPLFEMHDWAAIDRKFCGGTPDDPTDLGWIVDLHLCGGEAN